MAAVCRRIGLRAKLSRVKINSPRQRLVKSRQRKGILVRYPDARQNAASVV